MQTVTGYLYQNRIHCQIMELGDDVNTRSVRVYANPIKIYKNVDNPIRIVFRNKDQKRIHVDGYTFTFYMFKINSTYQQDVALDQNDYSSIDLDYLNEKTPVIVKSVSILDDGSSVTTRGVGEVILTVSDIANLTVDSYIYTIKALDSNGNSRPVYADDNLEVAGTVHLFDGRYSLDTEPDYLDLGTL